MSDRAIRLPELPPSSGRTHRRRRAMPALRGGHADGDAVKTRVFVEWNSDRDVPTDAAFGVRLNIKSTRRIIQLRQCFHLGVPVYVLFGHEAPPAGYLYTEDGLRYFLQDMGSARASIVALTNRNEWDSLPLPVEQVRAENAWAHRVCREFGIPFATSSTLIQDWYGSMTGFGGPGQWRGLTDLYKPGEVDGEYIDLHLYSYGGPQHLLAMVERYQSLGYTEDLVVGEFGTTFGTDIPVREMFDAILPCQQVKFASLFAMEAGGSDPSQDYGIRGKPAEQDFYDYAKQHSDGGDVTPDKPVKLFLIPSGQSYNKYPNPGDGDYAANEMDAMRWFVTNKAAPWCRTIPEADVEVRVSGEERTSTDLSPLRATFQAIVAYANEHPAQRVLAVSLHTDAAWAGHDNHFAMRLLQGESGKLCSAIYRAYTAGLYHPSDYLPLDSTGQGYIALPEAPSNLVPLIVEISAHATVDNVRWISQTADALAHALADGIGEYIAGGPAPIDWQARATAAEAKVAAAQTALVTAQNSEAQLRADIAALAKVLA